MGIDAKHPQYDANIEIWQTCRDCYEGERAIKHRKTEYLPRPGGLEWPEYLAYLQRASYYPAVSKTVDSLVGAQARLPNKYKIPTSMQCIIDDATADGLSLDGLAKHLCSEVLLQGRGGLLVDYDEKLKRAYLQFYQAENITNWSDERIVLREHLYENDPADPFQLVEAERYRELSLVDGVYTVTLWRQAKDSLGAADGWVPYGEPVVPIKRGGVFDRIPFVWLTPHGTTSRITKPPLLGLVDLSLSHFRNSADLQHGAHYTGLPTLVATGTNSDEPIGVGASSIIQISNPAAKVYYAEFSGAGLSALEKLLDATERRMASVGASILNAASSQREETATGAQLRSASEGSLLTAAVSAVQAAVKQALEFCATFSPNAASKIEVALNMEFAKRRMDGPTLTGLVQAYTAGALELSAFLNALTDGGILPTIEENKNV